MTPELLYTKDGSATLLNKELEATYHSLHGAMQESRHIFIEHGLNYCINTHGRGLRVLEAGFGTGLNALLTIEASNTQHLEINYTSIEKYPIPYELAAQLNYPDLIGQAFKHDFLKMHKVPWNEPLSITKGFTLHKIHADLASLTLNDTYHLIYFDAFAPRSSPELWEEAIFEKIYEAIIPGGCLVTFCAKGEVKRRLRSVGFRVETLPGPPGKREMTRAIKA